MKYYVLFITFCLATHCEGACVPRDFGEGSVVCVDTIDHCDLPGEVIPPANGDILMVVTTKAGLRWNVTNLKWISNYFNDVDGYAEVVLTLNTSEQFQKMVGFGGAFTDAAAINIHSLPEILQDCILESYFSKRGLEYNMGRVPIGGSDFSLYPYTYDDLPSGQTDANLLKFSLQNGDLYEKIPLIHAAQRKAKSRLKLVGSPWSGPAWMKENGEINGKGGLLPQYYQAYARYITRFLEEYQKHNISMWAVTGQNEPVDGLITDFPFNAMGWKAEQQASWIGHHLGPALESTGFGGVKIFVLDDNRIMLPGWLQTVMADADAARYVGGVAVHWYMDWIVPATTLDRTHQLFVNTPILYTEACTGQWPWQPLKVALGSWQRAQYVVDDILDVLNHWSVGWIDWNLALDLRGGPNWVKNYVDAPIIINKVDREVFKQPMYYAMGHVTKFIQEGSVRVSITPNKQLPTLTASAFKREDGYTVMVILNKRRSAMAVKIRTEIGTSVLVTLPASSITTLMWL